MSEKHLNIDVHLAQVYVACAALTSHNMMYFIFKNFFQSW